MKWKRHTGALNSYDEYALEEALLIKDRITTTEVHAVSVGPGRVEAVIKSALEMGSGLYLPFATYQRDGSQRYDFNQPKVIRLTLCPAGIPIANA